MTGADVTAADDGQVVTVRVGASADLVLEAPVTAEPTATGDAVELIAVDNVAPSATRQWELRGTKPGTVTLTAADKSGPLRVTVVVAP